MLRSCRVGEGAIALRPAFFVRPVIAYLLVVLLLALVFSVACGDGGSDEPAMTPTPPPDTEAIHAVDFTTVPEMQRTIGRFSSAKLDERGIIYADLTGDRRDEAAVPVDSTGTMGNVAYLVFTMRSGRPALILERNIDSNSGLVMFVEDGTLIETRGEFGPEDPLCCPSKLRKTTFRWDGTNLQVAREEQVPNSGAAKQ